MSYIIALSLTLIIETPIFAGLLRLWLKVSPRQSIPLTIAGNLLTHPVVWFITPLVPPELMSPELSITVAEVLAMIVEAAILRTRIHRSYSALLLVSFAANASSLLIGSALI